MSPTIKKFVNGVAIIFESEVQREQRELAEIENRRREREAREHIVRQAAVLRDKLPDAEAMYSAKCTEANRLINFSSDRVIDEFVQGLISIEVCGDRLAQIESAIKNAAAIKKRAHEYFVGTAERQLAEFEKQNAAALKGVQITAADEPPFVAADLGKDHYQNGAAAKLASNAITK